jgi:Extensin-like protein C-terminus
MLRLDHSFPARARLSRALIAFTGVGVLLSGCGFLRPEPREPWRAEAELACMRSGIVKESAYIRPAKPIEGPGPCGTDLPLKVSAFQNDPQSVALALASQGAPPGFASGLVNLTVLKPEATMGCPMVAWTDDWVVTAVQPAAMAWFGQGVKEIRTAGAYACRRRNHNPNARLSEHAYGNAIDVVSFVFNDGTTVTVKGGWKGAEQEQGFLRDVLHGACQRFKTVLGPGSNALHYDHFHLDLARHDSRGQRRYCNPAIAAPQRPAPGSFAPGANPWGGPQNPLAYRQPAGGYPPQLANGAAYQRPPLPVTTPLPPIGSGMIQPRSRAPDPDAESRMENEVEPDFDPGQFDLTTGTIPDLPRGHGGPAASPAPEGAARAPRRAPAGGGMRREETFKGN